MASSRSHSSSASHSSRSPSLSSRVHDYTYHPAVRWLSRRSIPIFISALLLIFLGISLHIAISSVQAWRAEPTLGAVASELKICSEIGADLLKQGGTAGDAIVGTMFCVGVVGMYHSGIGGGGFALVRNRRGEYETVDFREAAPAAAWEGMYQGNVEGSVFTGLASGVPGELRGLEYIHRRYGKLAWPTVMRPSIRLAREGWTVSEDLVRYMRGGVLDHSFLYNDPWWAIDFAPNGTLVGVGDTITRKRYAETLTKIASNGADQLYRGDMALDMIATIRAANGTMTMQDLADYQVVIRPAQSIHYRDYTVYGCGAPASGAAVLSALKTIEGYEDIGAPSSLNISTHRLDEAIRFAYAERSSLGDPAFIPDLAGLESTMASGSEAARRRAKISDRHTLNVSDYDPSGYAATPGHGTSHLVAADASGLAISLTSTINLIFGSRVIVPTTGVILNDQMNDFSLPGVNNSFGYPPAPANYIRPGKRPMSSMSPTIVEHRGNGSFYYTVGSAGGSRIVTAVLQNLWHVLDGGMGPAEALAMPRFHDQLVPNVIGFEWGMNSSSHKSEVPGSSSSAFVLNEGADANADGQLGRWWDDEMGAWREESGIGTGTVRGYDNSTVAFMEARGHNVRWNAPGFTAAHSLRLLGNGTFEAAGDPRQKDSGGVAV